MRILAIIISLVIVLPVFGQRKKKEDEELIPTYTEGIAYSLPRTGITVHVKAVKESFVPGPYAAYAEQLLGIKNVKAKAESNWKIAEIKIETFSEPDPGQVYKAMGDAAFLLNLTPEGCLAGINCDNLPVKAHPVKTNLVSAKPEFEDGFSFDYFTDTPFYTPGDSTNNYQPIRVDVGQKAAEAAQRVLDCRMNQYDMAAGMLDEFHPDGEAYKISLNELKKEEKSYLSLFVGRTTYKKDQFSINFVPTKADGKGEVIFRISDEKGVVPASDLSGKPVMVEFKTEKALAQKYSAMATSENPNAGSSGVYYRMPGMATIKIIHELNTIATARATIAQFGPVAPLPEDLLYGDFAIEIHPETGAIKSVSKK